MFKDNIDINDLIGKPYESDGGDGINSFDCASLVRYCTGIEPNIIPTIGAEHTREIMKAIIENKRHFKILDEPIDGCIVSLALYKNPSHVGVWIHGGVLHATPKRGVIFSTLQNLKENNFTWEFGMLKDG